MGSAGSLAAGDGGPSLPRATSRQPLLLTAPTVVEDLAAGLDLGDSVAAARTRLAPMQVHLHEAPVLLVGLVVGLGSDLLDCSGQHLQNGGVKRIDVLAAEARSLAQRQHPGGEEEKLAPAPETIDGATLQGPGEVGRWGA